MAALFSPLKSSTVGIAWCIGTKLIPSTCTRCWKPNWPIRAGWLCQWLRNLSRTQANKGKSPSSPPSPPMMRSSRIANSKPLLVWPATSKTSSHKRAFASEAIRSTPAVRSLPFVLPTGGSFVLTFKAGRTPALWKDFQSLLELCPANRLLIDFPDKTRQTFRWVNDLEHIDQENRRHLVHALICEEIGPEGKQTFAWVTDLRLDQKNVCAVANQAGRVRCNIENQGFNLQKNSGLNLEHAYSTDPDIMKCFYYLLQIAHLFLQMFEMGSLLRRLAQDYGRTPVGLFGSLKNIAKRLLECLRFFELPNDAFDCGPGQI